MLSLCCHCFNNLGQVLLQIREIQLGDFDELSLILIGEIDFDLSFGNVQARHSLVFFLFLIAQSYLLTLHLLLFANEALLSFTIHLENKLSIVQNEAFGRLLHEFAYS